VLLTHHQTTPSPPQSRERALTSARADKTPPDSDGKNV